MHTGSLIRLRVRKRLCVSVWGGKQSIYSPNSKVFGCFWCVLYNELLFWISYSDSVYLTQYGNMFFFWHVFKHFSKNVPEVWTIFVLTMSLRIFGIFVIFGHKWSLTSLKHPYHGRSLPLLALPLLSSIYSFPDIGYI